MLSGCDNQLHHVPWYSGNGIRNTTFLDLSVVSPIEAEERMNTGMFADAYLRMFSFPRVPT